MRVDTSPVGKLGGSGQRRECTKCRWVGGRDEIRAEAAKPVPARRLGICGKREREVSRKTCHQASDMGNRRFTPALQLPARSHLQCSRRPCRPSPRGMAGPETSPLFAPPRASTTAHLWIHPTHRCVHQSHSDTAPDRTTVDSPTALVPWRLAKSCASVTCPSAGSSTYSRSPSTLEPQ